MSAESLANANMATDERLVRAHLQRVLASTGFRASARLCRFLAFIVEETLLGNAAELKESVIGCRVFDRNPGYDTKSDAIVRVEARRLRTRLEEFYRGEGAEEQLRFLLPKGTYAPEIVHIRQNAPQPLVEPAAAEPDTDAVAHPVEQVALPADPAPAGRAWTPVWIGVLVVVVLLLAGAVSTRFWMPPDPGPMMRPFTAAPGVEENPAFSPDGERIAYVAAEMDGDTTDVYVRNLQDDQPVAVVRTPGVEERGTAWAPDGRQIAFLRKRVDGRMLVITRALEGGAERTWGDVSYAAGAVAKLEWSPDGRFLLATDQLTPELPSRIVRFWLTDGRREWLTTPPVGSLGDASPALSPDGSMMAFRRARASNIEDIWVLPLGTGAPLESEPRRITFENRSAAGHDWMPDGKALIVSLQRESSARRLWKIALNGAAPERIFLSSLSAVQPTVARTANRVVWVSSFEDMNIWSVPTDGSQPARPAIVSTYFDMAPQVSPDGGQVLFRSNRSGLSSIWISTVTGGEARRLLDLGGAQVSAARWSPDGKRFVFEGRIRTSSDLYIRDIRGGDAVGFATESAQEILPWWSSDGKWIYYASDRSGEWQVWKRPVSGGEPIQCTRNGGFAPAESSDGRWLYYTRGPRRNGLFRVAVSGGEEEAVLPDFDGELWGNWAVAGDRLFYVDARNVPEGFRAVIRERNLVTGATREVHRMTSWPARFDTGLAVTPDAKQLLFAQLDRSGADLFYMEGFR